MINDTPPPDDVAAAIETLKADANCYRAQGDISDAEEIEQIADMLERQQQRIKELKERERWIPVSERLPDKASVLAVAYEDGGSWFAYFIPRKNTWSLLEDNFGTEPEYKITHWKRINPPEDV